MTRLRSWTTSCLLFKEMCSKNSSRCWIKRNFCYYRFRLAEQDFVQLNWWTRFADSIDNDWSRFDWGKCCRKRSTSMWSWWTEMCRRLLWKLKVNCRRIERTANWAERVEWTLEWLHAIFGRTVKAEKTSRKPDYDWIRIRMDWQENILSERVHSSWSLWTAHCRSRRPHRSLHCSFRRWLAPKDWLNMALPSPVVCDWWPSAGPDKWWYRLEGDWSVWPPKQCWLATCWPVRLVNRLTNRHHDATTNSTQIERPTNNLSDAIETELDYESGCQPLSRSVERLERSEVRPYFRLANNFFVRAPIATERHFRQQCGRHKMRNCSLQIKEKIQKNLWKSSKSMTQNLIKKIRF